MYFLCFDYYLSLNFCVFVSSLITMMTSIMMMILIIKIMIIIIGIHNFYFFFYSDNFICVLPYFTKICKIR